jgi:predicted MFS family arabinose efflux permease
MKYEYRLVLILFLGWGLVFLDRNALSLLLPVMVGDMSLNNTQIGQINMWQSIGYAISGPLFAILSDRLGSKKRIIVLAILATSIFAFLTTFTNSYSYLLVIRTLLGASEGAIMPVVATIVAAASSPGRFGRNIGIVYSGGPVIGGTIGPMIVTQLAALTNWRMAFLLVSIPSFIVMLLVWRFIKEVPVEPAPENSEQREDKGRNFHEVFKYRNVVICIFMSIFSMAGLWTMMSFSPIYFTTIGKLSVERMGLVMSLFGVIAILWMLIIANTSDYIGRKSTLIICAILATIVPLTMYFNPVGWLGIITFILLAGTITSIPVLYASIIPVESVPPRLGTLAGGIILGVGELVGSFAVGISGSLADTYGLPIVLITSAIVLFIVALLGISLKESNMRKVKSAALHVEAGS